MLVHGSKFLQRVPEPAYLVSEGRFLACPPLPQVSTRPSPCAPSPPPLSLRRLHLVLRRPYPPPASRAPPSAPAACHPLPCPCCAPPPPRIGAPQPPRPDPRRRPCPPPDRSRLVVVI
ncbi:hypothetical protein GQ55_6G164000 [Panicum hallii var. hallii]|uniref:Uncharacterized protein n=1 Tax=Panicum hallii var. hallii TaxID=1504633 RepID=A0A2T7D6L3_9POAL|nr:hypothetical protein GQ55_6G164000 [Panicum hallii var. hallii]